MWRASFRFCISLKGDFFRPAGLLYGVTEQTNTTRLLRELDELTPFADVYGLLISQPCGISRAVDSDMHEIRICIP